MDIEKLHKHIKLCKSNLKNKRVKCCTNCPFEEEILNIYPKLEILFEKKRKLIEDENKYYWKMPCG